MTQFGPVLRISAIVIAVLALASSLKQAWGEPLATDVQTSRGQIKPPLSPLPKPPSRRLPKASTTDLETLDSVLSRVSSLRSGDVQTGLKELLSIDSSLLAAIKARLDSEAKKADRARMKRLLLDIRKDARLQIEKEMREAGIKGPVETPDYLEMILSYPREAEPAFTSLANVLALSRLSKTLASVEALRVLVHVYVRFDFLRIDTQLQLQQLGEKALPALIESTRHPAPKVANWATRQLDFLGKAIPSEAVQVADPEILADILRAYGRLRDPDAARLVASFANSERAQVREAARQSITLFGEVANWQLRDTYEKMVGKRPPREWSWDRTAKELFREFDLIRLAELYQYFDQGLKAQERGDLEEMRAAFEKVLTRDPGFKPNQQISKSLLSYGIKKLEEFSGAENENLSAATAALERVARISEDEQEKARAQSMLLFGKARAQLTDEFAEELLLRRALALDSDNALASQLLKEISREPLAETSKFMRFLWPALLMFVSLVCAALVLLRRSSAQPPISDAESH